MILRQLKILIMRVYSSLAGIPVVNLRYGAAGNNSCDLPHFQGPIFFRVTGRIGTSFAILPIEVSHVTIAMPRKKSNATAVKNLD